MKKTHWLRTTLITLVACGLAGLLLAVILFQSEGGRTGASAKIEFSFDGAADGIAPNGYRFDLSGFASDEVLNEALQDAKMADRYTADQLRENLLVSGVYPEDIVSQMTRYESLITGDAGRINVADYHATLYNVLLYNDFDKTISRKDLEKLLSCILAKFRAYFEKTYSFFLAEDTMVSHLSDYDYTQQIDILTESLSRSARLARQMASEQQDFLLDGEGFSDIAASYEDLINSDLERISGQIIMNALSRDKERIVAQYENDIRLKQLTLQQLKEESEHTEEIFARYNKDDIIYVATSDALRQVGSTSTKTYDTLASRYQAIQDEIAETNKELNELGLRWSDITGRPVMEIFELTKAEEAEGSEETETVQLSVFTGNETELPGSEMSDETKEAGATEETEISQSFQLSNEEREIRNDVVEKNIETILKKREKNNAKFVGLLKAYSEKEMNERTIAISETEYNAPSLLSGAFIKKAVKTAGPLCALGFIACLVGIIFDRMKEGKQ